MYVITKVGSRELDMYMQAAPGTHLKLNETELPRTPKTRHRQK